MKRNPKNWCLNCGSYCRGASSNLCRGCYYDSTKFEERREAQIDEFGKKLKREFSASNSRHRYQAIRHHAHRVMSMTDTKKVCWKCGYSIYVELCHLKAIGDFDEDTPISEINDLGNLRYLCPNHHKELDLGILEIDTSSSEPR